MSTRVTRSRSRRTESEDRSSASKLTGTITTPAAILRPKAPQVRPCFVNEQQLAKESNYLPKSDFSLLRLKQRKLRYRKAQVPAFVKDLQASPEEPALLMSEAASATLVFVQEAAGTAVCISPDGLLLTCSHCIAESEVDYKAESETWLLFASGDAVKAKCFAWDAKRDLALLQITTAFTSSPFPYVRISDTRPEAKVSLVCIGHPGSEDFEVDEPGTATGYDVLHISKGRFHGLAKDQDPQDNSEIGALMHDCWTYWGHSGAPLVEMVSGKLIGLHSSWDDQTAMRRGVGWDALKTFLEEHTTCVVC